MIPSDVTVNQYPVNFDPLPKPDALCRTVGASKRNFAAVRDKSGGEERVSASYVQLLQRIYKRVL